jgi:hypothetical protein
MSGANNRVGKAEAGESWKALCWWRHMDLVGLARHRLHTFPDDVDEVLAHSGTPQVAPLFHPALLVHHVITDHCVRSSK